MKRDRIAVQVVFDDSKGKRSFTGPVTMVTFGSEQYVWKPDGPKSYADPDGPPVASVTRGSPQNTFTMPKASVTVLRGKIERSCAIRPSRDLSLERKGADGARAINVRGEAQVVIPIQRRTPVWAGGV